MMLKQVIKIKKSYWILKISGLINIDMRMLRNNYIYRWREILEMEMKYLLIV